jgi:adenylate cyclase
MTVARTWICKGCWQHMRMPIPIRGPLALPFRLFGIRISQMNPNLCTVCETMFTRVKKKKQVVIPATVLFADLRGYTRLSERIGEAEAAEMLDCFYDACCSAVWEGEGIVNKFIGDAVLAVFNFPILREDHVRQAVLAGMEIQRKCREQKALWFAGANGVDEPVGIGVGIHTGQASIGEVGTAYKDFTIIGPVVNTASRLQAIAGPGEIVVTEDVYRHASDLAPAAEQRSLDLRGIDDSVNAYVLRP